MNEGKPGPTPGWVSELVEKPLWGVEGPVEPERLCIVHGHALCQCEERLPALDPLRRALLEAFNAGKAFPIEIRDAISGAVTERAIYLREPVGDVTLLRQILFGLCQLPSEAYAGVKSFVSFVLDEAPALFGVRPGEAQNLFATLSNS